MSALQKLREMARAKGLDEQKFIDELARGAAVMDMSIESVAKAMLDVIDAYNKNDEEK